jgi:hypothetical protein
MVTHHLSGFGPHGPRAKVESAKFAPTMPRLLILVFALTLVARASFATIIIAVGTKDGLLVCEDRRVTTKSSNGQISFADAEKAQQLGKFGFFTVAGDLSGRMTNFFGQSITTFDILAEIPAFFKTHDIQQFNEQTALEFEAHLRDQLNKKPVNPSQRSQSARAQTEVLLYWMDQPGQTHLYVVDIASALDSSGQPPTPSSPLPLAGRFLPLELFSTSKPRVTGRGLLGYNAIVSGADPNLDDLRRDEELKPFLSNFVDAASVDSIAAARALKKLIRGISEKQNWVQPDGLDVGPVSDCLLGTADGIKNINQ